MKVRLDVEYYDEDEKELLKKNYPSEFNLIDSVVQKGYVVVPLSDFKTYTQMHHQNSEYEKLISFQAIQENIGDLFGNVKFYTHFDEETGRFYSDKIDNNEQNHVSESVGCGGALSVISHMYGLTQADWQRIAIQGHKDFDFDSAIIQDFKKKIVVEAKGTITSDNTKKASFSHHKTKIKEKKEDEKLKEKYENDADLLIGAITVIDDVNHAKVYLVDPPEDSSLNDVFRFKIKLLKRLTYYCDWMSIISQKSYLTVVLKNRIKALKLIDDIQPLNLQVLTNSNDKALKIDENFLKSRCYIGDSKVGRLHTISHNKAVFIGLDVSIYNLIALQDFNSISKFKTESFIERTRIDLKVSKRKAERDGFIRNLNLEYGKPRGKLFHFIVEDALVYQNSAGFLYSIITTKNNYSLPYEFNFY